MHGSTEYSAQGEGTQFEFYKNPLNRIKCIGSGGYQAYWWERSPRLVSAQSTRTAAPTTTSRRTLMGWPLSAVSNIN